MSENAPSHFARLRALAIVGLIGFGIIATVVAMVRSAGPMRGGAVAPMSFMAGGGQAGPVLLPDRDVFTAEGEVVSLRSLRGKVVVLNIWATSCAPCVVEMPSLNGLQATLGSEHFMVAPVALQADREEALAFYGEHGLDALPFFADPTLNVGFDLAARGMPTTVVFNADGVEIARHAGVKEWDSAEAIAYFRSVLEASGLPSAGLDDAS